jgi:hypothetical protein
LKRLAKAIPADYVCSRWRNAVARKDPKQTMKNTKLPALFMRLLPDKKFR